MAILARYGCSDVQIQSLLDLVHEQRGDWKYCGIIHSITEADTCDCDLILASDLKDFSNNIPDAIKTIQNLKLQNIHTLIPSSHIDTRTDFADMLLSTLLFYATKESDDAGKRVKNGISSLYDKGIDRWCRIYGYTRSGDDTYIVVPSEAEVVRRIFSEYEHGKSIKAICDGLNDDVVPSMGEKKWVPTAIRTMLVNEKYAGHIRLYKGMETRANVNDSNHETVNKGVKNTQGAENSAQDTSETILYNHHTPIIEQKTFSRVQKILAMKKVGGKGKFETER